MHEDSYFTQHHEDYSHHYDHVPSYYSPHHSSYDHRVPHDEHGYYPDRRYSGDHHPFITLSQQEDAPLADNSEQG